MSRERFEYLLAKELYAELSPKESVELTCLLHEDVDLAAEYRLFRMYWMKKESHSQRDSYLFKHVLERIDHISPPERSFWTPSRIFAIVALFAIILSASFFFYFDTNNVQEFVTKKEQRAITLEDGTHVVLNSKSKLLYPIEFSSKLREVTVVGEAFFKVAVDKKRPFIIHTEQADLKVLGTSFNVRSYPDEEKMVTSLIEGALEIQPLHDENSIVRLRPKEKLVVYNANPKINQVAHPVKSVERSTISFLHPKDTMSVETTWLENKLAFKDTRLEEIVQELERKYDVEIKFGGNKAQELRFSAVFDKENIEGVMRALSLASNFEYQIHNNEIIIHD